MNINPALKRLGLGPRDRVVLFHADDIGMCQATVEAFAELQEGGIMTCGAYMVPCPWFPAAAEYAREHPQADLGVHLTLNSEWEQYRWPPLTGPVPGLVDSHGYFHQRSADTQEQAEVPAVRRELESQIQRALDLGLKPTHIDTHMGTAAHEKFLRIYGDLAVKFRLPAMIPRLDEAGWKSLLSQQRGTSDTPQTVAGALKVSGELEEQGFPLVDHIRGLPLDGGPENRLGLMKKWLGELPPGITHFIFHPAKPSRELAALDGENSCRGADYEVFLREELREFVTREGIHSLGYRALQEIIPGS